MTNTAVPHETTTITILLLTGPSGSGKTTVTQSLSQTIETHHDNVSTSILHQDDYFTQPFRPYEQRVDASYEDDSGIDYEKLRAGILLQITSAVRRQREATTTREYVLLVEGHLANAQKLRLHSIPTATLEDTTRHHCTTCVHVQSIALSCSMESCAQRRLHRTSNRPLAEYSRFGQPHLFTSIYYNPCESIYLPLYLSI